MKTSFTSILTDVVNIRRLLAVAAFGLLAAGPTAHADMVLEMDQADASATRIGPAGNFQTPGTCFNSTFRLLYQGDNYAACQGSGGPETAGYWFDTRFAPRVLGSNFVYDNGGLYCVYAKWADGVERGTNVRFQIDWNSPGIGGFVPDTTLSVNQTINGGQWVKLACSTAPSAGQAPVVKCSNFGLPAGRFAICDGIKITREQVDGGDIINSSITGSDIASNSVSSGDLSNEAGYELSQANSRNTGVVTCSQPQTSWTVLSSITLTTPSTGGIVWVHANGISKHNTDNYARVCISRAGSNCTSWLPVLDQSSTEVSEGNFENETRWVVSDTFPATGGSQTFYLRACQQTEFSNIDWFWDDFVGFYFPTNY